MWDNPLKNMVVNSMQRRNFIIFLEGKLSKGCHCSAIEYSEISFSDMAILAN